MVALWPASTTTGSNGADGLAAVCHRSPVGELTSVSKAAVVADSAVVAVSFGPPVAPNAPDSTGAISHSPCSMGLADNDAPTRLPTFEPTSGSPVGPCMSNWIGCGPDVLAWPSNV